MPQRILAIDDDREIVRAVRAYLEESGFEVIEANDGAAALDAFRQHGPDLVLLDLSLPQIDGIDVARAIRRDSNVPIIMLTARVEEADRVVGLELGADDYVTKPFSPRELVARVRAVLRRSSGAPSTSDSLRSGGMLLDTAAHTVTRDGAAIDLTPSEFAMLHVLMENAGHVLTRLQLIEKALGYSYEGFERTVDTHVKNLRQKLEPDPRTPTFVTTVYGVGYKFAPPVNAP